MSGLSKRITISIILLFLCLAFLYVSCYLIWKYELLFPKNTPSKEKPTVSNPTPKDESSGSATISSVSSTKLRSCTSLSTEETTYLGNSAPKILLRYGNDSKDRHVRNKLINYNTNAKTPQTPGIEVNTTLRNRKEEQGDPVQKDKVEKSRTIPSVGGNLTDENGGEIIKSSLQNSVEVFLENIANKLPGTSDVVTRDALGETGGTLNDSLDAKNGSNTGSLPLEESGILNIDGDQKTIGDSSAGSKPETLLTCDAEPKHVLQKTTDAHVDFGNSEWLNKGALGLKVCKKCQLKLKYVIPDTKKPKKRVLGRNFASAICRFLLKPMKCTCLRN